MIKNLKRFKGKTISVEAFMSYSFYVSVRDDNESSQRKPNSSLTYTDSPVDTWTIIILQRESLCKFLELLKGLEPVVVSQQSRQRLGVKLVVAEVERRVDRLEGFEVDVDLLLLALVRDDRAAVDDEAVRRHFCVQLQSVLDRGDGAQHGQPVDARLDVGSGAVFVSQHLADSANLKTRGIIRIKHIFRTSNSYVQECNTLFPKGLVN